MQAQSTVQFISKTKLGELGRQRDLLVSAYANLIAETENSEGVQGLRIINDGLRKVSLDTSKPPLHRDLPNLSVLLKGSSPSSDSVDQWVQRFKTEAQRGIARANIAFLFGALLGDWDDKDDTQEQWANQKSAHDRLLKQMTNAQPDSEFRILEKILSSFESSRDKVTTKIEQALKDSLEKNRMHYLNLNEIANNPNQIASVRQEAKRFVSNDVLTQQIADAVSVAARDPSQWEWDETGVKCRVVWTRNKWRLYPELSLVEILLLGAMSDFWTGAVEDNYSSAAHKINRLGRLQKLEDLGAPEVITRNERRMLKAVAESIDLGWYEPHDPWEDRATVQNDEKVVGIVSIRAGQQAELRQNSMGYYGGDAVNPMVKLVHAEIQTLIAAFPNQPLHVVKLDLKDYFGSVPHEVLLRMLAGLGMPQSGIDFVQRFLSVPIRVESDLAIAKTGVLMEQRLSHWLCEWLMRLLERYVYSRARVRIIRQIDDICLLSPTAGAAAEGWKAIVDFVRDCGLQLNEDKCGATSLGGDAAPELPAENPRWGMLELTSAAEWKTHQPTFDQYLSDARDIVNAKHAILGKVMAYNEHLKHLTTSLGLAMDLGAAHRESMNETLSSYDKHFFGRDNGIVRGLLDSIGQRYEEQDIVLSESWMAWPITAGGLSLRLANVLSGQYQIAFNERLEKRKSAPGNKTQDWQYSNPEWSQFYEDQLVTLEPAACRESARMNQLVKKFIARGSKISGGEQEGLSEYWRWVLSIHGQSILDQFGTFEFLMAELVPLQLIHEKLMQKNNKPL